MAQFDVSFLNKKFKKSGGGASYGILIDQLDILESQLESDGKLSPGDYDMLNEKAQQLYSAPGLSESNRSNILTKIERYRSLKKSSGLNDANNLTDLNNDVKNDQITSNMLLSSNPKALVDTNIKITRAKINRFADSIDQLQGSGQNASAFYIEYDQAIDQYNDLIDAKDQMAAHSGDKPIPGYAAYITTNTKGEITDVKIAKAGAINGYAETNGLYGGLQIYGKPRKEGDKQVFKIGGESFSAANIMVPDPANPGSFKTNQLTSDSQKVSAGRLTRATAGTFQNVDLSRVRAQTSVPAGSYAQGSNGFFYQAKEDGTYKKIVNATPETLGIDDSDFIRLPREMESSAIMPRVSETVDWSVAPSMPLPTTVDEGTPSPVSTTTPNVSGQDQRQGGTIRTPGPTSRAPTSASGVAESTQSGAKGFFQKIFSTFKSGF